MGRVYHRAPSASGFFGKLQSLIEPALAIAGATFVLQVCIELSGAIARNAQGLPLARAKVFCQKNDLTDVIGVVHQLAD